jgi:phage/plasmid-like protein (TIGR03299 family)
MSHELETNGSQVAFVDNRNDAWHQLNNLPAELVGQKLRAEEALEHGHLANWDVRKVPAFAVINGQNVRIPGKYATVRNNPWTPGQVDMLGCVGTSYTPVQNEENVDVLNAIIDETGATIETAGSLREGKNTFVTMKLPETMNVAGTDKLDLYIAGLNSHDGTSAYQLLITPVRIVCANTQNYALRNFVNKHSIRHTKSAKAKIEQARQALGLSFAYLEEFQAEAERMLDTAMTEAAFVDIIGQIWPVDDEPSKRGATIAAERTGKLTELFSVAATQAPIRDTNWAGLQAVTEYLDHFGSVRNGDASEESHRAERAIVGTTQLRQAAFDLFSVSSN